MVNKNNLSLSVDEHTCSSSSACLLRFWSPKRHSAGMSTDQSDAVQRFKESSRTQEAVNNKRVRRDMQKQPL